MEFQSHESEYYKVANNIKPPNNYTYAPYVVQARQQAG